MFDKDQDMGGPGTVVGSNVKLNGIIKDLNDITVHGTVDGEVISEKNVTISESATVKGPVSAQVVTISGKVNGTINAVKKLEITPTGKVYGSISTKDLVIRSGAIFVGKSSMVGIESEKETKTPAPVKHEENAAPKTIKPEEKPQTKTGFWGKPKTNEEK